MRVLEERRQAPWTKEVVCEGRKAGRHRPGCGSRLLLEAGDLRRVRDYESHKGAQVAVFKCPLQHCGVESDLSSGEVPAWVFDSLPEGQQRGEPAYCGGGKD